MIRLFLAGLAIALSGMVASAQESALQPVLQEHRDLIAKSSRMTISPAIDAIATSGAPQAQEMLEQWAEKNIWMRKSDGLFFIGEKVDAKTYALSDIDTGRMIAEVAKSEIKQLKPNSGVRAMIQTALVQFQLSDPNPSKRQDALTSIARDPEASLLAPLRRSIDGEVDKDLRAQKKRLERLLTIGYDEDTNARVAAIKEMSG
ncbi:MAG: urea ABC transporter permease subunit UrtB, partial [Rhodobacteraceae bacterium]|nr:urea ABC transporter permease subunit UrtB [Paracoccaceae bacterium]